MCLIDLINAIHEQQCCGGVADEERETTNGTAYDPAEEMVRMTGASVGNSLESSQPCNRPALCWTTDCVGCGFDGASAMSSERDGAAALVKSKAPLADYFHCTMHSFNLSASQSSKIVEIRHCLICIQEAVSFFRFSAKRTICLENVIK